MKHLHEMKLKSIIAKPKGIIVFIIIFNVFILFGLSIAFYNKEEIRVFLFFFMLFILYANFFLISRLRVFTLKTNHFVYGFTSFNYDAIEKVSLYDKRAFRFCFLPMQEEGVVLTLKNGKKVYLLEGYIGNLWQLRYFFEQRVIKNNKSFDFDFNLGFYDAEVPKKIAPVSLFVTVLPYVFYTLLVVFIISFILLFVAVRFFFPIVFVSFFMMLLMFAMFNEHYIESTTKGIIVKNFMFTHMRKKIAIKFIDTMSLQTIIVGKGSKKTVLVIKMIYHKEFRFGMMMANEQRIANMIAQANQLKIPFNDLRTH